MNVVEKPYGDGGVKPVAYDYRAIATAIAPSVNCITVNANGRHVTDAEKTKLAGIADGANNYVHPSDASSRHVTDTEKDAWNAKASTELVSKSNHGLMSAMDKVRFDLCANVQCYGTVGADGNKISGSKGWASFQTGVGRYRVTRSTSGKTLMLLTGRDATYASIAEDTSSYFTVYCADDEFANNASFNFITFNLPDIL